MTNVLTTKNPASDYATAQLIARLQESYQAKATQKVQDVADRHQTKINTINRDVEKWRTVKADIGQAASTISGFVGSAKSVLASIDNLISTVNKAKLSAADADSDFRPDNYSSIFDSQLRSLNMSADSGSRGVNPMGPSEPDFKYQIDLYGETNTVSGNFIGTGYTITEADGKIWKADVPNKLLYQYGTDGGKTGKVGAFGDLQLDSLSGTAISFTTGADTASPESYSGTLSRTGTELLNAWAYEGLATDTGRDAALADLYDAKTAIELEVKRYETAYATAGFYEERANTYVQGLREEANGELLKQTAEVSRLQKELAREYQHTTSSVALAMAAKKDYSKFFGQFAGDNKVAKALMNIYT